MTQIQQKQLLIILTLASPAQPRAAARPALLSQVQREVRRSGGGHQLRRVPRHRAGRQDGELGLAESGHVTPSSPLIGPGGADQAHAEDAGRAAGAALGLAGGSQELTRTEADGVGLRLLLFVFTVNLPLVTLYMKKDS